MRRGLIALVLCALPMAAFAQPRTYVTEEMQRAMVNFVSVVKSRHYFIASNDPRQAWVQQIGLRLANQARRPVPWQFAIVGDAHPNAACTGEGVVYVTTGLLDLGLDEDELAGVLAHEVAHGARQHAERYRVQVERAANAYKSVDIKTAEERLRNDVREAQQKSSSTLPPSINDNSAERLAISNHILQSRLRPWGERTPRPSKRAFRATRPTAATTTGWTSGRPTRSECATRPGPATHRTG